MLSKAFTLGFQERAGIVHLQLSHLRDHAPFLQMTTQTEVKGRIVRTWKNDQRILWTYVPELPAQDVRRAMPWLTVLGWEYDGSEREGMPTAEENQHMLTLDVALGKME